MAGLILIALVIVLVIGGMIAFLNGVKFWKILIAFVVILGSYHLYVSHTCGPNPKDVKVMKPMAEAISNYIVKNGIPKSLKKIPDLPYELEGCEREIKYPYLKIQKTNPTIEEAKFIAINERCSIDNKKIVVTYHCGYYSRDTNKRISTSVSINFENYSTETGSSIGFIKNRNNKLIMDRVFKAFSRKDDGICNPMRQ